MSWYEFPNKLLLRKERGVKNFKYTPILHNEYMARQEARDKSNNKSSLL